MSSDGVGTNVIAAAVEGRALIIVNAREAIDVEGISNVTAASETSSGVGADLGTTAVRHLTLVIVEAGLAIGVERVA